MLVQLVKQGELRGVSAGYVDLDLFIYVQQIKLTKRVLQKDCIWGLLSVCRRYTVWKKTHPCVARPLPHYYFIIVFHLGSSCDGFSGVSACACPGSPVEYLCTVSDPSGISSTRWNGTAFQCPGNQVALLHHQYDDSGGAQDTCNDGSITAQGLANVTGNCYTSMLTVNQIEPELNGRTVVCLTSGRIIGGTTIRIAGVWFSMCMYVIDVWTVFLCVYSTSTSSFESRGCQTK